MDEFVFGANIIENLTTGMYKESIVCYREYVQNACDQIDKAVEQGLLESQNEGTIEIWFDDRNVSIEDNATGIPQNDFTRILANVADSDKRIGSDKGFRGIGRLCGLAYCRELVFTTTAFGEDVVSIMKCDAQKMRELLNRNVSGEKFTATEVLQSIYQFDSYKDANITSEHWFRVEMKDINEENSELLDLEKVKKYLSFVAPVPYQNIFPYSSEIYAHAKEIGYKLDEYRIKVDGEDVFKRYSTRFKTSKGDDEIFGVEFKDFYDNDGNLIMWLWFGLSNFKAVIASETEMRGLRLRAANIQIGDENALQKLFKEDRGQHYFVGEVFSVSKDLIPNSQRDYFNSNEMRIWFENELKRYFKDALQKVYHGGSAINSSFHKIDAFVEKAKEFQAKEDNHDFVDETHKKQEELHVKDSEKKADEAQRKIDKYRNQPTSPDSASDSSPDSPADASSDASAILTKVLQHIEKDRKKEKKPVEKPTITPKPAPVPKKGKPLNRTDKLSKCSKQERKLIGHIWSIIQENTDADTAELLIQKIEDAYK